MAKLPILKSRDCDRILKRLGFTALRQSGSHVFYQHPDGRTTLVPNHPAKDIGRGLLRKVINDTGLPPNEFLRYL